MRHFFVVPALVISLATMVACSNNPSAPSGQTGATINGTVASTSGSAARTQSAGPNVGPAVNPPGLTVSVTGSGASAIVDAAGRFALLNVPPGNVELRFNAPGVLALATLTSVQSGDTIDVAVTLSNTTAEVDSDHRRHGSEEQLEGRVESLPPTTAALSLMVSGHLVQTDATTTFLLNGAPATFASLAIGQRVHVKGQTSGGALMARQIDIQNTNVDIGVNVNGIVAHFTGTLADFQFTVDGRLVKGDAQTVFFGNSQFLDLANGARVEVKGSQRDAFVYATRIHVN